MDRNNASRKKNYLRIILVIIGIMVVIAILFMKQFIIVQENIQLKKDAKFLLGFYTAFEIESTFYDINEKVEQGAIETTEKKLNDLKSAKENIDFLTVEEHKLTDEMIKQFNNAAKAIVGESYEKISENTSSMDLSGFFIGESFYYANKSAECLYNEGLITEEEYKEYWTIAIKLLDSNSKKEIVYHLKNILALLDEWHITLNSAEM